MKEEEGVQINQLPGARIQLYLEVCPPNSCFLEAAPTTHFVRMMGHALTVTAVGETRGDSQVNS